MSLGYYGAFTYPQRTVGSMRDLNETFEQIFCFEEGYFEHRCVPALNRYSLLQFLVDTAIIVSEDDTIQPRNTKELQLFRKAGAKLLVFIVPEDYGNCKLHVLFPLEYGLFYSLSQTTM